MSFDDTDIHSLTASLLESDFSEAESRSISEQDAKVRNAVNPITRSQSAAQVKAIFQGHEGIPEDQKASIPLHGNKTANTGIISEKPIHRSMAFMVAQGLSQREVAVKTGYSDGQVSQICRQTWFRELVTKEIEDAGRDQVQTLLDGSAVDAVMELKALMTGAKAESVRLGSVKEMLDRVLGKAPQHITQDIKTSSLDPQAELESLQQELAVLDAKKQHNN